MSSCGFESDHKIDLYELQGRYRRAGDYTENGSCSSNSNTTPQSKNPPLALAISYKGVRRKSKSCDFRKWLHWEMVVIFHTRYVISSGTRSDENKPENTIHTLSSCFLETWFHSCDSYCYQKRVDIHTLHMGVNSVFTILITC